MIHDARSALDPDEVRWNIDDFLMSIPNEAPPDCGHVYAVLDGSVIPGLYERFASDDLSALCLFQGDAEKDLRDVAPYLVRLPPDSGLLTQLLEPGDKPWQLWDKRAGVFLQSDVEAELLVKHLRRFLRVQYQDTSFFFRFWEPSSAIAYFDAIVQDSQKWYRWFFPWGGGTIDRFIIPHLRSGTLRVFNAGPEPTGARHPKGRFEFSEAEMQLFSDAKTQDDIWAMECLMRTTFPKATQDIDDDALSHMMRRSLSRMVSFGIKQRANVFRIAAWDLHSDGRFETKDATGEMRDILELPIGEADKMRRLSDRLAEMSQTS